MKTLRTRKILAATVWANIRQIPPKEFSSVEDMEVYAESIRKPFKEVLSDYEEIFDRSKQIQTSIQSEQIGENEAKKLVKKINQDVKKLDEEAEKQEIEINLEDKPFNLFFDLISKIIKNMFNTVDSYIEFKKDLDKSNSNKIGTA